MTSRRNAFLAIYTRIVGHPEVIQKRVFEEIRAPAARVEDIDPLMKRLEHLVARSNATLLAAACIVGLLS
jgi:hypothetical protein